MRALLRSLRNRMLSSGRGSGRRPGRRSVWGDICSVSAAEHLETRALLSAAVSLVRDIHPGNSHSFIYELTDVDGTLFFRANDGTHGVELWKSDGTSEGTTLVKDIFHESGDAYPRFLTNVNGTLFFTADDGTNGTALWRSNGSLLNTRPVEDVSLGDHAVIPHSLTNVNGTLFFGATNNTDGFELWKSNGTPEGTTKVRDIHPGSIGSTLGFLTNVNGTLFFSANDGTNGSELWRSDGTEDGTILVRNIRPGHYGSHPISLTNVNGTLFFLANDGTNGSELWKSDGTEENTKLVRDIHLGSNGSDIHYLTNVNGTLFFTAVDGVNGRELWKSDGTESGTVLVRDIVTGEYGSYPRDLTSVNDILFFTAFTLETGRELWKSDGTTAGTVLVADIDPGASGSAPMYLANMNGTLFFNAHDGVHGYELMKSDGTAEGTMLVSNIRPGILSSHPQLLTNVNGTLFFAANDGTHGIELWIAREARQVIGDFGGDVVFTEKNNGVALSSTATVVNSGSATFAGGTLSAELVAGSEADDQLLIRTVGTNAGQINVLGNEVRLGSIVLGTFTGGTGTTPLTISLNINATPARVQTLLRNILFRSVSANPSAAVRRVRVRLNSPEVNGEAVEKQITVIPVNDRPVIASLGGNVAFTEKGAAVQLTSTATVTDVDSANLNGGFLRIQPVSNFTTDDRLLIRTVGTNAGQINVQGNQVRLGTLVLGTFTGGTGTTPLTILLNVNATPARVQVLLRNILFSNVSNNPSSATRTVNFVVNDGQVSSTAAQKQIAVIRVNDRPDVANVGGNVTFTEKGAAVQLTSTATVTDVDHANLNGGFLRIQPAGNFTTDDRLLIRTVGTNAGQINVQANRVQLGTLLLGTFTGGTGTTPLVISLNANATPARVQVLLRNILFSNVSNNPSSATRTVSILVNDGQVSSLAVQKQIAVIPVNDRPVVANLGGNLSFRAGGAAIPITSTATISDPDSPNFAGGSLRILFSSGGHAQDRLLIRTVGTNAGQINVLGSNVRLGTIVLGTFTGGTGTTPLVITLNANATPARVQVLLRNIMYRNLSATPAPLTKSLRIFANDGLLSSIAVGKDIAILQ